MLRVWLARISYAFICNIPVSFCLSLTANIANNNGQFMLLSFLVNYVISLAIAISISLFLPLVKIGRFVTKMLRVDNRTFSHNIKYRVVATCTYSCIYFIILNPILAFINNSYHQSWIPISQYLFGLARSFPLLFTVGFCSSILFDIPAFKVAKRIDHNF